MTDYPPNPKRCSVGAASLRGSCRGAAFLAPLASPCVGRFSLGLAVGRRPPARPAPSVSLYLVRLASGGPRYGPALAGPPGPRAGPTLAPPRPPLRPGLVGAARLRFALGARAGVGLPPLPLGLPLPAAVLRSAVQPSRLVRPPLSCPTAPVRFGIYSVFVFNLFTFVMIQKLNSCNYEPTTWQAQQLEALQNILTDRYGKSNDATLEILKAAGFTPQWLRVRWTGGVGSYSVMRRKILRVLVSATKSGFSAANTMPVEYVPGIVGFVHKDVKRRGFRYGWCVELHP